jgi:hypothetical protein
MSIKNASPLGYIVLNQSLLAVNFQKQDIHHYYRYLQVHPRKQLKIFGDV